MAHLLDKKRKSSDVDPLFEFDAPRFYYDISNETDLYSDKHDSWFQISHAEHETFHASPTSMISSQFGKVKIHQTPTKTPQKPVRTTGNRANNSLFTPTKDALVVSPREPSTKRPKLVAQSNTKTNVQKTMEDVHAKQTPSDDLATPPKKLKSYNPIFTSPPMQNRLGESMNDENTASNLTQSILSPAKTVTQHAKISATKATNLRTQSNIVSTPPKSTLTPHHHSRLFKSPSYHAGQHSFIHSSPFANQSTFGQRACLYSPQVGFSATTASTAHPHESCASSTFTMENVSDSCGESRTGLGISNEKAPRDFFDPRKIKMGNLLGPVQRVAQTDVLQPVSPIERRVVRSVSYKVESTLGFASSLSNEGLSSPIRERSISTTSTLLRSNSSYTNLDRNVVQSSSVACPSPADKKSFPVDNQSVTIKQTTTKKAWSDLATDEQLLAQIAEHNKKFKPRPTYVPLEHSSRDLKEWENRTGKKWHDLTPREREKANEEMAQQKKSFVR